MKRNICFGMTLAFLIYFAYNPIVLAKTITITNENTKNLTVTFKSEDGKDITLKGYDKKIIISPGTTLKIESSEEAIPTKNFAVYGTLGILRDSNCVDRDGSYYGSNPYVFDKNNNYSINFSKDKIGTTCKVTEEDRVYYH
jgi:hypothetical protein